MGVGQEPEQLRTGELGRRSRFSGKAQRIGRWSQEKLVPTAVERQSMSLVQALLATLRRVR